MLRCYVSLLRQLDHLEGAFETVYRVTFQTGEDPYLNSQFVIEYVSGMQGDLSTSGYL